MLPMNHHAARSPEALKSVAKLWNYAVLRASLQRIPSTPPQRCTVKMGGIGAEIPPLIQSIAFRISAPQLSTVTRGFNVRLNEVGNYINTLVNISCRNISVFCKLKADNLIQVLS